MSKTFKKGKYIKFEISLCISNENEKIYLNSSRFLSSQRIYQFSTATSLFLTTQPAFLRHFGTFGQLCHNSVPFSDVCYESSIALTKQRWGRSLISIPRGTDINRVQAYSDEFVNANHCIQLLCKEGSIGTRSGRWHGQLMAPTFEEFKSRRKTI